MSKYYDLVGANIETMEIRWELVDLITPMITEFIVEEIEDKVNSVLTLRLEQHIWGALGVDGYE